MTPAITPPARLLVVGASQGIGRACAALALEKGFTVRALSRSPEKIDLEHPNLELFAADATDAVRLGVAVEDCAAVIIALGVPLNTGTVLHGVTLFSEATDVICAAMSDKGPRRLVAVTGIGTSESSAALSTLEKLPWRGVMGRIYDDKSRQEDIVRASAFDWTIARPGILTNGDRTGRYQVMTGPDEWRNGLISRADVADFVVGSIEAGTHLHSAPVIAR